MGRKKIHLTIEAKRAANLIAKQKHYEANKERLRAARMERYYADKKLSELQQDT
jgi:hypothetical protein